MTVRKQDDQIMRGVRLLAKKECAYYDSAVCLCNERPCRVIHPTYKTVHDGAVDCDFFLHAVLPAQPELNVAVWHEILREDGRAGDGWKVCARCYRPFIPSCNRQRYCAGCGKAAKKARIREKQRRYRARKKNRA